MKGHLEQALVNETVYPNEIWHRRLPHVHYKALPLAIQAGTKLLKVFQKFKQNMMESAKDVQKEGIQRINFPSSEIKAKGILEIIHFDVCGPMSSSSLSGYVYYVSFIDDFYKKTWN